MRPRSTQPDQTPEDDQRPWIGVHFTCAGRYVRVQRHHDGQRYLARCPQCGKCIRFVVGQGGTNQRIFQVSC